MTIEKILDDCANTIRQQEAALLAEQKHNEMLMAEIEQLKNCLFQMQNACIDLTKQKPVVWISVLAIDHIGQKFTDVRVSLTKTDLADIPLYTHPVRELTDEEIFKIAIENGAYQSKKSGNIYPDDMYILNFARAILRKASEK